MAIGVSSGTEIVFLSGDNFEQQKISATENEATTSFTQTVRSVHLYNDGADAVHIHLDATATTNHYKLTANSSVTLNIICTDVHTICAAGETATIYVIGVY